MNDISRPKIREISLAEGLKFSGSGYIAQEKYDGVFHMERRDRSVFIGEKMRDGRFIPFDMAVCQGDDCRRSSYNDRWNALRAATAIFPSNWHLPATGMGGEFLEAVLARGGEGVVFKHLEGHWGVGQWKAKRFQTYDVKVVNILQNAVEVEYEGVLAGKVAVNNPQMAIGSIIEIGAYCITASGKFREGRFIRTRHDKA